MNERYIRWWTPHLSRDFEMLAFGNGGGIPLVLFPTSSGRHSQNKDFGLTDAIAGHVDSGKITIYCPDSIDLESFYNREIHPADRMRTHNAYERVITHDIFALEWRFAVRVWALITPPISPSAIPMQSATLSRSAALSISVRFSTATTTTTFI